MGGAVSRPDSGADLQFQLRVQLTPLGILSGGGTAVPTAYTGMLEPMWGPRAGDSDSRALLPRPRLVLRHLELLDEFARENIDSLYKVNFSKGRDALSAAVPRREPRFHLDREIRLQRLSHSGSRGRVGFRLVSVPARACGHQGLEWGAGPGLLLATELTLPPLPQCNSTGGDCFYRSYASGVAAVQDWYRFHYVDILALLPEVWEDSHGRQDGHFVLSCSYDGVDCQAR